MNATACIVQTESKPIFPKSKTVSQIVPVETISIADLDNIKVDDPTGDDAEQTMLAYRSQYLATNGVEVKCDVLRGYAAWIKGQILNRIKPVKSKDGKRPPKKTILHGKWKQFCEDVHLTQTDAYLFRRIALAYKIDDARTVGLSAMKKKICPSRSPASADKQTAKSPNFSMAKVPKQVRSVHDNLKHLREHLQRQISPNQPFASYSDLADVLDLVISDAAAIKALFGASSTAEAA